MFVVYEPYFILSTSTDGPATLNFTQDDRLIQFVLYEMCVCVGGGGMMNDYPTS